MAEAENQEPSMEEILASIRRIISEDGATVEPAPKDEADAPVLDLVEEVKSDGTVAPVEETVPVVEMEDFAPVPAAPAPEPEFSPPPQPMAMAEVPDMDGLLSNATAQAAGSVLSSLSSLRRPTGVSSLPIGNGGQTLENMVLEVIRPYLKEWLDSNLPTLVERVVQKEIQKITRDLG